MGLLAILSLLQALALLVPEVQAALTAAEAILNGAEPTAADLEQLAAVTAALEARVDTLEIGAGAIDV